MRFRGLDNSVQRTGTLFKPFRDHRKYHKTDHPRLSAGLKLWLCFSSRCLSSRPNTIAVIRVALRSDTGNAIQTPSAPQNRGKIRARGIRMRNCRDKPSRRACRPFPTAWKYILKTIWNPIKKIKNDIIRMEWTPLWMRSISLVNIPINSAGKNRTIV